MKDKQAITELMAEVKIIAQALQEIRNYMTIVDKRITALEVKQDNVKNELLAKIVNNSPICRNCDIYRDAWNVCFMASECLTNGFKFCKRRNDEVEE